MSSRPSRRVTARRTAVVESSDEDMADAQQQKVEEDSGDDFTPAPAPSPRRTRRKTMQEEPAQPAPSTPKPRRGRPKKSIAPAPSIEPSEVFDPDQTAGPADEEPLEIAKKPALGGRRSVAPRASKAATPELQPPLPTPKPSVSPASADLQGSPLSDITVTTINEQRPAGDETVLAAVKPIRAMDALLEKPMDIVLKSRTMQIPMVEDTGPKPRIVITYLILTNFKSYAGRQEVGPFHASFSSVVGPNGSGKSNVIDSLLFVFGFRASKMRQGKISALIHNSAQYPDLEYCEVAVHFQEVMDVVSNSEYLLECVPVLTSHSPVAHLK
jgi:structural maintenance of chromosome 4